LVGFYLDHHYFHYVCEAKMSQQFIKVNIYDALAEELMNDHVTRLLKVKAQEIADEIKSHMAACATVTMTNQNGQTFSWPT
jgi:hypothetical protein